ncbi:MAG: undecaprenyl-diphosphate phosphatase [Eubacterium sp.]|nr:undecaprenyl-diphosphate phosphatase [Eubacterium sp.]
MILLKTLLLGFLTGLAAFFPVSSVGTLIIGAHMFSVPVDQRLFAAMMLGIFLVLVLSYYSDIIRLFYSLVSIFRDLIYNLKLYVKARGSEADYRRILTGNYRNFLVMLLTALIPTVILGLLLSNAASAVFQNDLITGMMFFITAVILLVSSFMDVPEKGPRQMKYPEALIMGCFSGFAMIPGLSKIGAVSSAGFLCGVSRKLTVKFSCLLSMISIFLILLPGRIGPSVLQEADSGIGICIAGFLAAFCGGYLFIRRAQKLISKDNNKIFAGCNVMLGMLALLMQMLAR